MKKDITELYPIKTKLVKNPERKLRIREEDFIGPHGPSLYQTTTRLIQELGDVVWTVCDVQFVGVGTIHISQNEGKAELLYDGLDRTFVWDGRLLIERVTGCGSGEMARLRKTPTNPDQFLKNFIRDGCYPKPGEPEVEIRYGDLGYTAILSRWENGVLAQFIEEQVVLAYHEERDTIRIIRDFHKEKLSKERREWAKEKKKTEFMDDPVTQLNKDGKPEIVDRAIYRNEIQCIEPGCPNVRYVQNADLFQVIRCKPCQYKEKVRRACIKPKRKKKKGKKKPNQPIKTVQMAFNGVNGRHGY